MRRKRIPACGGRGLKGVITVELSYLFPIILMIFLVIVYTTFYFHDKNILIGAASETAVVGAQLERRPGENGRADLAGFYQERIRGKLILFSGAEAFVDTTRRWVEVSVYAERKWMRLHVVQRAALAQPETAIRRLWLLDRLQEAGKKETTEEGSSADQIEGSKTDQKAIGQTGSGTAVESQKK